MLLAIEVLGVSTLSFIKVTNESFY